MEKWWRESREDFWWAFTHSGEATRWLVGDFARWVAGLARRARRRLWRAYLAVKALRSES